MNEDELKMVLESVVSNYEGATIEYYSTFHRSGRQTKKIVIEYDVKTDSNDKTNKETETSS
jgi:hypothetical protein